MRWVRASSARRWCTGWLDAAPAVLDVAGGTGRPVACEEARPVSDFDALLAACMVLAVLGALMAWRGLLKVELKRPAQSQPRRRPPRPPRSGEQDPWEPEPPF